jgi:hypothetical protein
MGEWANRITRWNAIDRAGEVVAPSKMGTVAPGGVCDPRVACGSAATAGDRCGGGCGTAPRRGRTRWDAVLGTGGLVGIRPGCGVWWRCPPRSGCGRRARVAVARPSRLACAGLAGRATVVGTRAAEIALVNIVDALSCAESSIEVVPVCRSSGRRDLRRPVFTVSGETATLSCPPVVPPLGCGHTSGYGQFDRPRSSAAGRRLEIDRWSPRHPDIVHDAAPHGWRCATAWGTSAPGWAWCAPRRPAGGSVALS